MRRGPATLLNWRTRPQTRRNVLESSRGVFAQWMMKTALEPDATDSLPTGWTMLAQHETRYERLTGTDTLYTQLARLPSGGWVLVAGLREFVGNRDVVAASETFEGVYVKVNEQPNLPGHDLNGYWVVAARMLNSYIATCYDPDDVAEAAEQVLVGLGAKPTFLPRSLVEQ